MNRRSFLLSADVGIGVVSATAYYFFDSVEFDPELAEPQSLSLIWDTETIKSIGSQYRKNFPSEKSERSLIKIIKSRPTEEMITSDFKNGNIVIVDGWVLSVTEARQCALASAHQCM